MTAENKIIINYRSVKYAAQKVKDLLSSQKDLDPQFIKHVFLSTVAYVLKKKADDMIMWQDPGEVSEYLGTPDYPLYRFVYDYIENHIYDCKKLNEANLCFIKERENKKTVFELEFRLDIIFNYLCHWQEDVFKSLGFISSEKVIENISESMCVRLYMYLISMKYDCLIESDYIQKCMDIIKQRLFSGCGNDLYWQGGIILESPKAREEWELFKKWLAEMHSNESSLFESDYSVEMIDSIINEDLICKKQGFLRYLNVDKMLEYIHKCSPDDIDNIRGSFQLIYNSNFCSQYDYALDYPNLMSLRDGINNSLGVIRDVIKRKQLVYFVQNIDSIASSLEHYYREMKSE